VPKIIKVSLNLLKLLRKKCRLFSDTVYIADGRGAGGHADISRGTAGRVVGVSVAAPAEVDRPIAP